MLQREMVSSGYEHGDRDVLAIDDCDDFSKVFFKSDRIYKHNLLRINHTTYDVRRSQDVINPRTSRRDIMLLADNTGHDSHEDNHRFLYARVLGIYHVNVIYTGTKFVDYTSRRLDFLWVRWFCHDNPQMMRWKECKLDSVSFPPMASEGAFGFVDPSDVLRASYIVPRFKTGRVHSDLVSLSRCAKDSHDWKRYYVDRYVGFSARCVGS
jgi:hypothetical protein